MSKGQFSLDKESIIVIDDNELVREQLKHLFEALGATVYVSSSVDRTALICQGLKVQNVVPRLIIADVRLHGIFGLHLLQVISSEFEHTDIPIIVVSSGFNQLAMERMKFFGVVAYVEKPVFIQQLFDFSLEMIEEAEPDHISKIRPA
jgi:CheY-like chemotaxis protein